MSDHMLKPGCYGVQAANDAEAILHGQGPAQGFNGRCRDNLTGLVLKDSLAIEARMVELAFFHNKSVCVKQPLAIAKQCTGRPPITVCWVDTKKGAEP